MLLSPHLVFFPSILILLSWKVPRCAPAGSAERRLKRQTVCDSGICGRAAAWTLEVGGRAIDEQTAMFTWTWPALLELITQVWLCAPRCADIHVPSCRHGRGAKWGSYRSTLLTCYSEMLIFPTSRSKKTKMRSGHPATPLSFKWKFALGERRSSIRSWIIRLAKSAHWKKKKTKNGAKLVSHERLARRTPSQVSCASCHPQITPSNWPPLPCFAWKFPPLDPVYSPCCELRPSI